VDEHKINLKKCSITDGYGLQEVLLIQDNKATEQRTPTEIIRSPGIIGGGTNTSAVFSFQVFRYKNGQPLQLNCIVDFVAV